MAGQVDNKGQRRVRDDIVNYKFGPTDIGEYTSDVVVQDGLDDHQITPRNAARSDPNPPVEYPPADSPRPNPNKKLLSRRQNQMISNKVGEVRGNGPERGNKHELPIQARIRGPGPAHYMLPTMVGRNSTDSTKRMSPAYSFGSRSWSFKNDSPGPAYMIEPGLGARGKGGSPSFSFGGRPKEPQRRDLSPGPGAYNTDKSPLWEKKAPAYSLSPRTKQRPIDLVPSPNVYNIPSTLGTNVPNQKGGVATSMTGRSEHMNFSADLAKTPGPARYGSFSPSLTKNRPPQYSIQGRTVYNANKKDISPGPGAYDPTNPTTQLGQSPRHVIGVRHSEFVLPTLTMADIS